MPGLRAATNYVEEPPRHPSLLVNCKEPFNAEAPRSDLLSHYITPVDSFFKRSHGPIPVVDDITKYSVQITGLIEHPTELSLEDIKNLPKSTVTASIQCAGNRRTAMNKAQAVLGVDWDIGAIGNAIWVGVKLADVLERVGIPKLSDTTSSGGKHIEFVGIDKPEEGDGGQYRMSIPLSHGTDPDLDVLLAYEMNGEALIRDHGYPLRVLVPGVIGARSVKWLESINILAEESQGHFMQNDYKMQPPYVNSNNVNWPSRRPVMRFPVQSAISSLQDNTVVPSGKVSIKGYAISGGGVGIERVDISVDGGKTWAEASRSQKADTPYVADSDTRDKWAWVLFEFEADIQESTEIVVKAVDAASNVQPDNIEQIWNILGILNNSWHRVKIQVGEPTA